MTNLMEEGLLSSDSEDDDYVPCGADGDSEDEQSGEEEDLSMLDNDGAADTVNEGKGKRIKKKKTKKAAEAPRKRTGGIMLEDDPAPTNGNVGKKDEYNEELVKQIQIERIVKKKDDEKKKADSLWDDFMKDVGSPKAKPKVSSGLGSLASLTKSSPKPSSTSTISKDPSTPEAASTSSSCAPAKITITKEYDFAGETVKITKEVSADSKEAKEEEQKLKEEEEKAANPTAGPSLSALGIGAGIAGLKRPGGLSNLLGKLGKKQKISTLDKSKLDWEKFKNKEGISEELTIHNKGKDGYIERQNFLQRTDLRQFEQEREMRIKNRKPFLS